MQRSSLSRFVLLTLATTSIAGCAYFIPENPSAPRHNKVEGDFHRPMNNSAPAAPMSPQSALTPEQTPAEEKPVALMSAPQFPPVDEKTQARAEQVMAAAPVAAPAPIVLASNDSIRRMPSENMSLAASDMTNALRQVPERPAMTGPDSTKEKLQAVESTLEKDRVAADNAREKLSKDAAAEPSLLSEMPKEVAPAPAKVEKPATKKPEPVSKVEETKPAPVVAAAPVVVEPKPVVVAAAPEPLGQIEQPKTESAALPPLPAFMPPAPLAARTAAPATTPAAPAPVAMAAAPVAAPAPVAVAPAPAIKETAPVAKQQVASLPATSLLNSEITYKPAPVMTAPAPEVAPAPLPVAAAAPAVNPSVAPGDFDPLATAQSSVVSPVVATDRNAKSAPSVYASNNRYLAPSRYSYKRY